MENILTEANLLAGIHLWRTQKPNWPRDFHNEYYQELSRLKQNGLNANWWRQMVNYLSGWRALRPLTKEEIHGRAVGRLGQLQTTYNHIVASHAGESLNLTTVNWESLEELYSVAFDIKDVNSPVFGSKLCHFILPNAFPVIDRDVIGVDARAYHEYWQFCKVQWTECTEREALQQMLRQAIGEAVHIEYPYSTKVTELCIIGSRV
ncbi:MAG: hypothetical protein ABJA67_06250 [Chthonomonadales bacterium]